MRIKEFCKRLGIHRTTALKLEERGLLHPQRDWAGHRRFTDDDLQQAAAVSDGAGRGIPLYSGAGRGLSPQPTAGGPA